MPLSPLELAIACAATFAGAFVQGSIGFGMALAASPILVMIDPTLVPAPLLTAGISVTAVVAFRERHGLDLTALRFGLPGLIVGSAAGAAVLVNAPADRLPAVFGALVLLAVVLSVAGLRTSTSPRNVVIATLAAGFMGTTASIPGPPLALLYQNAGAHRLKGTLAPLLLTSDLVSLTMLRLAGRFGAPEISLGMLLIPSALIGVAIARRGAQNLPADRVRAAVLGLSAVSAVLAIARGLG
jgi:uncharacterized membrane protein YfcA